MFRRHFWNPARDAVSGCLEGIVGEIGVSGVVSTLLCPNNFPNIEAELRRALLDPVQHPGHTLTEVELPKDEYLRDKTDTGALVDHWRPIFIHTSTIRRRAPRLVSSSAAAHGGFTLASS